MSQRSPFNKRNMPKADEDEKTSGLARKSASAAKPAREAAQGVRVVKASKSGGKSASASRSTAKMTKEEKRAARREQREREDLMAGVANAMMKKDPEYVRRRRLWWVFLSVGLVSVFLSFGASMLGGSTDNPYNLSTPGGILAVVSLVVAYAAIIGALVYEFVRIRPIRNAVTARARGLSDKKKRAVLEESYAEEDRRRAEKAARKARK